MKKTITDELFDKIWEENISYSKKSDEEKKNYWIWTLTQVFHYLSNWEKIDISQYREQEPNIDLYLNDIIYNIESYHWEDRNAIMKNYFILDEQAEKALEISNQTYNTSSIVEWTIQEEEKDTLDNITFEELAEKIWDLYYDALSFFLSELSENINNNEVKTLVKESSKNIEGAWDLCKIPTQKFLEEIKESWKKIDFKHTNDIKWLNINKQELAKIIWELEKSKLKDFLETLSYKMQKDWDADYYRKPKPREKLWTELYACADKLKKASELI